MKIGFANLYHDLNGMLEFHVISGTIHITDQEHGYLGYTKSKNTAIEICLVNGWKNYEDDVKETLQWALDNVMEQPPLPSDSV